MRKTNKFKNTQWFATGTLVGATMLSFAIASVPTRGKVTDDSSLYENLSEIRVPKAAQPNFDSDLKRLSAIEGRYREKLPSVSSDPRLLGPMKRLAKKKYKPTRQQAGQAR